MGVLRSYTAGCVCASVQCDPSAPAASAVWVRCVAHALKGDQTLRPRVFIVALVAATLLDSRWVRARGTIAAPPCCLFFVRASACDASQGLAAGHRMAVCPQADDNVSSDRASSLVGGSCIHVVPLGGAHAAS